VPALVLLDLNLPQVSGFGVLDLQPNEATASNRVAQFLLKDPDTSVRGWAASLIGDLGPAAQVLSPALRDALGDPEYRVQQDAMSSLKRLNTPSR
jgi:hypothetical protein